MMHFKLSNCVICEKSTFVQDNDETPLCGDHGGYSIYVYKNDTEEISPENLDEMVNKSSRGKELIRSKIQEKISEKRAELKPKIQKEIKFKLQEGIKNKVKEKLTNEEIQSKIKEKITPIIKEKVISSVKSKLQEKSGETACEKSEDFQYPPIIVAKSSGSRLTPVIQEKISSSIKSKVAPIVQEKVKEKVQESAVNRVEQKIHEGLMSKTGGVETPITRALEKQINTKFENTISNRAMSNSNMSNPLAALNSSMSNSAMLNPVMSNSAMLKPLVGVSNTGMLNPRMSNSAMLNPLVGVSNTGMSNLSISSPTVLNPSSSLFPPTSTFTSIKPYSGVSSYPSVSNVSSSLSYSSPSSANLTYEIVSSPTYDNFQIYNSPLNSQVYKICDLCNNEQALPLNCSHAIGPECLTTANHWDFQSIPSNDQKAILEKTCPFCSQDLTGPSITENINNILNNNKNIWSQFEQTQIDSLKDEIKRTILTSSSIQANQKNENFINTLLQNKNIYNLLYLRNYLNSYKVLPTDIPMSNVFTYNSIY